MNAVALTDMKDLTRKAASVASLLKELGNEKRLLILCALMDCKETNVADLAQNISLSQSALSQHLARLREQGLISFRREGTTLYYRLSDSKVGRLLKSLKSIYC